MRFFATLRHHFRALGGIGAGDALLAQAPLLHTHHVAFAVATFPFLLADRPLRFVRALLTRFQAILKPLGATGPGWALRSRLSIVRIAGAQALSERAQRISRGRCRNWGTGQPFLQAVDGRLQSIDVGLKFRHARSQIVVGHDGAFGFFAAAKGPDGHKHRRHKNYIESFTHHVAFR